MQSQHELVHSLPAGRLTRRLFRCWSRPRARSFRRSTAARTMFPHCFLCANFIGTRGNAFAIGEHEPLMEAHFRNDVLGHCKRPSSKLTQLNAAMLLVH